MRTSRTARTTPSAKTTRPSKSAKTTKMGRTPRTVKIAAATSLPALSSTPLTPAQRQQLKGLAHSLEPIVLIGTAGLTPAVLKEIDASLKAHELIKIKASGAEREQRDGWLTQICAELSSQPVQHIGKILVVYRENPENRTPAGTAAAKSPAKPKTRASRSARPKRT